MAENRIGADGRGRPLIASLCCFSLAVVRATAGHRPSGVRRWEERRPLERQLRKLHFLTRHMDLSALVKTDRYTHIRRLHREYSQLVTTTSKSTKQKGLTTTYSQLSKAKFSTCTRLTIFMLGKRGRRMKLM